MACEAAFHDPRFPPVESPELARLQFEVSVLHPLEEVPDPAMLDPHRYGIVVSTADGRRGALLPAIEGIETVPHQLALARRKGAIGAHETVRIQRFEVDRFH
jgi:AMMECR1 domain-containing protein